MQDQTKTSSDWQRVAADRAGFHPGRLEAAVQDAVAGEIDWPEDVSRMVALDDPPPYNRPFGPTKPRGAAAGVIVRDGLLVADWGDPARVDMTFSATKSYLSTCVGLAFDRGMIEDLDHPVGRYVDGEWFESEHNRAITWRHLLQQTSEWSGTLFDIPDTVDHNRSVARGERADPAKKKGVPRPLNSPGTYWEYNDVRVNLLGFAGLHVWREPLADVLRREIMDPLGASATWQWHPYDNAYVDIDGVSMPSVPGGAHWGGGLWISALDHARFGALWAARGRWQDKQLISEAWIDAALTPCDINPSYGFMWWLNPDQRAWRNASPSAFSAQGAGGNVIFIDPERSLVVVTRWAGNARAVVEAVIDAMI